MERMVILHSVRRKASKKERKGEKGNFDFKY